MAKKISTPGIFLLETWLVPKSGLLNYFCGTESLEKSIQVKEPRKQSDEVLIFEGTLAYFKVPIV